jgi:hypothetical protein
VRRAWVAVLVAALLAGCEAAPPTPGPASGRTASPPAPSESSRTSPGPRVATRLPAVVLVADLSRPPARWDRVAFVPFGRGSRRLGLVISRQLTPVPIVPPSFAVAPDGSLWFLDIVKHRLAHYSGSGAFLGAIGGLQFDRFHPYAQDVGFGGGRLHVLEARHRNAAALLRRVPGRLGPRIALTVGGRGIAAEHFVSPLPRLSVEALGSVRATEPPTGGVVGDVEVNGRTGAGTAVPAVLLADGQRLGIEPLLIDDGQEVLVRHMGPSADSELPIRVRARGDPATPPVPAVAGWHLFGATEHSIVAYVQLVPAGSRDQERYGGGQWLLQVFDDGKALVWEPVPRSRLRGADIKRDLAVGFDGRIYLMLATRRGMSVYRRPA